MSDRFSLPRVDDVISRRSLLRGGAAAVALATLPSCDGTASPVSAGPASTVALNGIWWIGDWQGIAGGVGAFHLVWNDTRTGKLDLFAATVRP